MPCHSTTVLTNEGRIEGIERKLTVSTLLNPEGVRDDELIGLR